MCDIRDLKMSLTEAENRLVVTRPWERGGLGRFGSKDKKDIQEVSAATRQVE